MGKIYFFIIIYLTSSQLIQAQSPMQDRVNIASFMKKSLIQNVDSVTISYSKIGDKETSSNFLNSESEEIRTATLSSKEMKYFNKLLTNPSSYVNQLSGLNDRDMTVLFYMKHSVVVSILISSTTRDISIIDGDNLFQNRISTNLEKYITKVMYKNKLWDKKNILERFTEF